MKGIGVSPGISIGKACIIEKIATSVSGVLLKSEEEKELELKNFETAVFEAVAEVEALKLNERLNLQSEDLEILDVQIEFLSDEQIKSDVEDKINVELKNANDAVIEVIGAAVGLFASMEDEYFRARAADVQDTGTRILRHLNHKMGATNQLFDENTILIAEDIAPSDTVALDITKIVGFATQLGGKTSHTAILAKAKGIPAVVGCGANLMQVNENDTVIIDGTTGEVIVNPNAHTIEHYRAKQKQFSQEMALLKQLNNLPAKTTDNRQVQLFANISNADDLELVFENGGEGVGLLRTELLFMGRDSFPSEEEQFRFYQQVAIKSKNKPVIVRTLDIGGDKQLDYFNIPKENNPFLGYRAIRICLNQQDIFKTQLKAILRASAFGNLKIMFPMISNLSEVKQAKECVNQVKSELRNAGIEFNESIELGIMIEIPSAALMADILAKEVDFFSIGTNDLCQYALAVDRMNDNVSGLYTHFNPGVLRLIQTVIEQAHKQHVHVGMCGEMASDPLATLVLLGMGLDEFSMSAFSLPHIKKVIISNSFSKAQDVVRKVMEMDNSESITAYLQEVLK